METLTKTFQWLDMHGGSVSTIATVIIAIMTGIYTFFTRCLWLVTKRQVDITQKMFEAAHRPFIVIGGKEK